MICLCRLSDSFRMFTKAATMQCFMFRGRLRMKKSVINKEVEEVDSSVASDLEHVLVLIVTHVVN